MILEPHEKLKLLRLRKKYTQSDLAQLTHCSQMEISRIERGEKKPNTHTRHMIEQILGERIWTNETEKDVPNNERVKI